MKIRGTAAHIAEKYMTLARDAASSGDIVTAENYLQHAEHYNRIIMAAQAQSAPQPYQAGGEHGYNGQRPQPEGNMPVREQPQPVIAEAPVMMPGSEPQPSILDEEAASNGAYNGSSQPATGREADAGRRRRRRYPATGPNPNRVAADGEPGPAPSPNGSANGVDNAGDGNSSDEAVAN